MKDAIKIPLWLAGALIMAFAANWLLSHIGIDPLGIRELRW